MPVTDIFDRPAAPRHLLICTGPCCNGNGAKKLLLDELKTKLLHAMNGDDMVGEATCVRRSCLGKCTGEPLAYVQPEESGTIVFPLKTFCSSCATMFLTTSRCQASS